MKRTRSAYRRIPSMIPLMPSPGSPNTVSTPQSTRRPINVSAAIAGMPGPVPRGGHTQPHTGRVWAGGRDPLRGWPSAGAGQPEQRADAGADLVPGKTGGAQRDVGGEGEDARRAAGVPPLVAVEEVEPLCGRDD